MNKLRLLFLVLMTTPAYFYSSDAVSKPLGIFFTTIGGKIKVVELSKELSRLDALSIVQKEFGLNDRGVRLIHKGKVQDLNDSRPGSFQDLYIAFSTESPVFVVDLGKK